MTTQNWNAIVGMCAIVITIYALRNSEAHYLPDLFGLALALAAPRQSFAIGAWLVVTLLRHSWLGYGLGYGLPAWALWLLLPGAAHMSTLAAESSAIEVTTKGAVLDMESESGNIETSQPVAEITPERIVLAQSELLARLVISGAVGITEAIQIGAGAKSGRKYQRWSRLVHADVDRLRNHYPVGSNLKRFD